VSGPIGTPMLDGIRVIDFCRVLAGPHCGKHLLDLGAEVIKVEPPGGDLSRVAFPHRGAISGYYAQQNAGKRNISVDLNVPEAGEAIRRLCDTADVIIENFRPGALRSFGLDYPSIAATNPTIVYVSMSGYGQTGSWASRSAYAPTVQAEVGITATTLRQFGATGEDRRTDAFSHGDVYTGLHGTIAVLAGLARRFARGQGSYADVAMAAVMTSMNERIHQEYSEADLGAEPPVLGATDTPFFTSPEGDTFVIPMNLVGSLTFPFYVRAMRRPDLTEDPRFATTEARIRHRGELHAIIQTWIHTFDDMASLDAQLDEAKIATGTIREPDEFGRTPWSQRWKATREVPDRAGGTFTIPGPPWRFDGAPELAEQVPAFQGEHNEEILSQLGYDDEQIAVMVKNGALVRPEPT
jgi:crotonobetainyl-CoA:carnitine CoA-transferase CaiB-like acyl-CoA transferase